MTRYTTPIILLSLLLFGAVLRFWGVAYDLPHAFNPDEAYIMDRAVAAAYGNLRHGVIFRGSLPYYITGLTIRLASIVYPKIKQGFPTFREAYVYDKTAFYVIGRAIVATYSVLTMIVLYFFSRALFSETIGLLSILIFSLNTLEIQYAHQVYSDTALSFFILLTFYTLLIAYKRKHQSLFLVSSVLIGIAMAQKLPAIILLPFSIFIYRTILQAHHISLPSQIFRYVLLTGIVIVVYIVSYPFIFSELSQIPIKWIKDTEPNFAQLAILEVSYTEKIRDYILWLRDGSGSILLLTTILGAYQILRKNLIFSNFLLIFALSFLLFIALGKAHWQNYILPIVPLTSLFSAIGLYTLYERIVSALHTKLFGLFLLPGLLLYPATIKAVWTAQSYGEPDTRFQEIQWFSSHHIDDSRVARDGYTSIGMPSDQILLSKLNLEQLRTFDYFVLSSWYSPNFFNERRHTEKLAAYYGMITRLFPKIAEFPSHINPMYIDDLTILKGNFGKPVQFIRGPTISIYSTRSVR